MSRFKRLMELRRLQEEALGARLGEVIAQVERLNRRAAEIHAESKEVRGESLRDIDHFEERLPPRVYEDFLTGQSLRFRKNREEAGRAGRAVEKARGEWLLAHQEVRRIERLAEREEERMKTDERRREQRELDEIAINMHRRKELS